MANVPITITAFGGGDEGAKVSPGSATVQSQNQAVWNVTPAGAAFSVDFDPGNCPFPNHHFDEQSNASGNPKPGSGGNKSYKYTVKVGKTTIDPRVIIP